MWFATASAASATVMGRSSLEGKGTAALTAPVPSATHTTLIVRTSSKRLASAEAWSNSSSEPASFAYM